MCSFLTLLSYICPPLSPFVHPLSTFALFRRSVTKLNVCRASLAVCPLVHLVHRVFGLFLVTVLLCLPTIKKAAAVSNSSLSRSPLHHAGGDMFTPCGFFIIRRPCQGFTAAQSGAHSLKRKSPHSCIICARALNISERR